MRSSRMGATVVALAAMLTFAAGSADARMGGGGSFGSRGVRTFSAPPVTKTAPNPAAPVQRSVTQPAAAQAAPGAAAATGSGFLGRPGFMGGLLGGMVGAGLFGLLLGHGFLGGMGGFGSILGLMLQFALLALLARWLIGLWQRRGAPAMAGASVYGGGTPPPAGLGPAGLGLAGLGMARYDSSGTGGASAKSTDGIGVTAADLDTFESRLGEIQAAYGREDIGALRKLTTPEMLFEVTEELTANAGRGAVNQISDVHLLQGDVAEAWREGRDDYATLAMRYALKDVTVDRASGLVLEEGPGEVTELWTFRRGNGGSWLLSAIQQA